MSRVLPILFNTDMVRAILDGRKTVTRRLIKPQPTYSQCDGFTWKGGAYGTDLPPTIKGADYNFRCAAPYHPGDILYVRETWGTYNRNWWEADYFMYRADYPDGATTYMYNDGIICDLPKWRPAIHMPKEAARIWLKVNDVRVERLHEITEEQAEKEGCHAGLYEFKGAVFGQEDTNEWTAIEDIPELKCAGVTLEELSEELDYRDRNGITEAREGWNNELYFYSTEELEYAEELWDEACYANNGWHPTFADPDSGGNPNIIDGFHKLWNSTIKKSGLDRYGWDANPWVWVIEFERREKPEGW